MVGRRAFGYFNFGGTVTVEAHVDPSSAFAAGWLRLNADDLLKWDQALYLGTIFHDSATAGEMVVPRIATGTPLGSYGFGFFVGTERLGGRQVPVIQHGGTISGFVTGFWRMPDERRSVIVLSDRRSERTTDLVGALAAALY